MLNVNKKSYLLYYVKILHHQKLNLKLKKCSINRFYNLEKSFAKLYAESYNKSDYNIQAAQKLMIEMGFINNCF